MIKRIRGVAGMLAVSAILVAPRAEAQVQLGWNSSMSLLCLNAACSHVLFTLNLLGLKPTDNDGNAVPATIAALASGGQGYVAHLTVDIFTGPGLFTSAGVTSAGPWSALVVGGGLQIDAHQTIPLSLSPVTVDAFLTAGGVYAFGYSGTAYLSSNTNCFRDSDGTVVGGPGIGVCRSWTYRQGDFNGFTTHTPEPMSMTLLATGLIGLGLASYRRRKKQSA